MLKTILSLLLMSALFSPSASGEPTTPEANRVLHLRSAHVHHNNGEYKEAVADYDAAIAIRPTCALYLSRAQSFSGLKQYSNAIGDCSSCLAIEKDNMQAIVGRAYLRELMDAHVEALADYDQVLFRMPNYADGYCGRAAAQYALGHSETAIADYEKALKANPKCQSARIGLATIYVQSGKNSEALHEANATVAQERKSTNTVFPKTAYAGQAFLVRAKVEYRQHRYKDALVDVNHALDVTGDSQTNYQLRGDINKRLGNTEAASSDYEKARQ